MKTTPLAINRILVPIDFSELSQHAFAVAIQLAQKSKALVKLLHVVELPIASGYGATYSGVEMNPVGAYQNYDFMLPELMDQSKVQMEKLAQVGTAAGLIVEQEVTADRIVSKLVSVVTEEQFDLVIIGSEEVAGLEEILIGSDAEDVVRHCPCPVLTVKKQHDFFEVKHILFPSDFSLETREVIPFVISMQEFFGATLHLLHVQTKNDSLPEEVQNRMAAFITENNLQNVQVLVQSNSSASDGILAAANASTPDLIIIPTHGRTGLAHLFHKSVAESVVNHATIPVLTFHWPVTPE